MQHKLAGISDPLEQLLALFGCWLDYHVARPTGARIIIRNIADDGLVNATRWSSLTAFYAYLKVNRHRAFRKKNWERRDSYPCGSASCSTIWQR